MKDEVRMKDEVTAVSLHFILPNPEESLKR
jgi:hypothetical protein